MSTMDKEVFMIHTKNDSKNKPIGVYSGSCHNDFEFGSASSARRANCHGIYEDKKRYKINKYKVTYTLIEEDVE